MSTPAVPVIPVIDYAAIRHQIREQAAAIAHQIGAPYVAGLHSVAQATGLLGLAVLAVWVLMITLRTGEFWTSLLGLAVAGVMLALAGQVLAMAALTWASIGTGLGVIVVCIIGGKAVTRRVFGFLF